jgi:hypothetical protein
MMIAKRTFARVLVALAAVGCCLPSPLLAGPASPTKPKTVDVALREGSVLIGQVVDPQGTPVPGAPVSLRSQGKQLVAVKTGKEGYFAFKGVRGGVYQIATRDGQGVYRVWSRGTAPPAAEQGALVVAGSEVVRGQQGAPPLKVLLTNPLVIGAVVATAVAVPVAIHNARQDRDTPASP